MERRFVNQRKSLRLENYDYSSPGAYFVTICSHIKGFEWFGSISRGGVVLNAAGKMVLEVWNQIPEFYPNIATDTFVVMPDHVHGIVVIKSNSPVGAGSHARPLTDHDVVMPLGNSNSDDVVVRFPIVDTAGQTQGSAPTKDVGGLSLFDVMQRYKSFTTRKYIQGVRESGWIPFEKRLWHRNYWEHIIQSEQELYDTQNYILENPLRAANKKGRP
jgi:putative transposase